MVHWLVVLMVTVWIVASGGPVLAADNLDKITLKDGSVIYGDVVDLYAGKLRIKTGFGDADGMMTVKWEDVTAVTLAKPGSFTTNEGSLIQGQAVDSKGGKVTLKGEPLSVPVDIPMTSIKAINIPPVQYIGNATLGISGASGNSEVKNIAGLFDMVARSEKLRLSIMGRYIYGETSGNIAARNALGTIKLDFFITKRFYWFANAYFEQDTFQDLKLRTALGTGPGYQFIDKGDFGGIFSEMTLSAEAGVAYFNEDFKVNPDQNSIRGRWALNLNWPIVKDRITIYHNHEGYPSLENAKNFYLITNTGAIFNIYKNFIIKPQVTWRFNNNPPAGAASGLGAGALPLGTGKYDTIYLVTFGYAF